MTEEERAAKLTELLNQLPDDLRALATGYESIKDTERKKQAFELVSGKCSPQSIDSITDCLIKNTNYRAPDMKTELRNQLARCMCGSKAKKLSQAEEVVLALDPGQRVALMQFMTEHK